MANGGVGQISRTLGIRRTVVCGCGGYRLDLSCVVCTVGTMGLGWGFRNIQLKPGTVKNS